MRIRQRLFSMVIDSQSSIYDFPTVILDSRSSIFDLRFLIYDAIIIH